MFVLLNENKEGTAGSFGKEEVPEAYEAFQGMVSHRLRRTGRASLRPFDCDRIQEFTSPERIRATLSRKERDWPGWGSLAVILSISLGILAVCGWLQFSWRAASVTASGPKHSVTRVADAPVDSDLVATARRLLQWEDISGFRPMSSRIALPSIASVDYRAFDLRRDGNAYLAQPVEFDGGATRTAYFRIVGDQLEFDVASFVGESGPIWDLIRERASAGDGSSAYDWRQALPVQGVAVPCRVYVRPSDYFNYDYDSPAEFLSFQVEDVDRLFSGWCYVPRDSPVAREFVRLFGEHQLASPDGQPVTRRWSERRMTLELKISRAVFDDDRRQFLVQKIIADSWLVPELQVAAAAPSGSI